MWKDRNSRAKKCRGYESVEEYNRMAQQTKAIAMSYACCECASPQHWYRAVMYITRLFEPPFRLTSASCANESQYMETLMPELQRAQTTCEEPTSSQYYELPITSSGRQQPTTPHAIVSRSAHPNMIHRHWASQNFSGTEVHHRWSTSRKRPTNQPNHHGDSSQLSRQRYTTQIYELY
jgi:hypothetical protein